MKDRLEKFIKTEGLTPSRFAEIMGVQPSSISHILGAVSYTHLFASPISPSISALGVRAATESITTISIALERIR